MEEAVYFIQKAILESDPKFRGMEFTISRNEHFNADGVRHEIDVLVRVNPATDFEAKLLFECKNWNTTVGKNEVIVLSEKIHVLSAARGFLVARSFSSDAEAQVRKDPRVKLVRCATDFQSALSIELFHSETELLMIEVHARILGADKNRTAEDTTLSHKEIWSFQGRPVVLGEIIKEHADHFYRERFKQEQARFRLEGVHSGSVVGRIEFDPGELISGDRVIHWVNLVCHYRVTNTLRRIRSQFDLHGYGRTYAFEQFEANGKSVDVIIVMKDDSASGQGTNPS